MWCLALQTGQTLGELQARTGEDLVAVFLPTTPNPTSGFVLVLPKKDVIELDMSVDEGIKLIMSMGVAVPPWPRPPPKSAPVAGESRGT